MKIILSVVVVCLVLLALSQYGRVSIEISNSTGNGEYVYTIKRQGSTKTIEKKSNSPQLTKLVRKGNLEVTVTQANDSSFTVSTSRGFLGKKVISLSLVTDKNRQFIGNNPSPCMFFTNQLYSYECGDFFSSVNVHAAASESAPTYIDKIPIPAVDGSIEGLVLTSEGNVMLFQPTDDEEPLPHYVYLLDGALNPAKRVILANLDNNKAYSIKAYRAGFIVYDSNFDSVLYFSSTGASPQEIQFTKPQDTSLKPNFLGVSGDFITVVYSDDAKDSVNDVKSLSPKTKNEIVLIGPNTTKSLAFNNLSISAAYYCGQQKMCLVAGGKLLVFDISGRDNKILYKLSDVNDLEIIGSDILVVRSNQIISFNVDVRKGYIDFRLGDYRLCGFQKMNSSSYILCLINAKNNKLALHVDQAVADVGGIDKKIAELENMPEISAISVQGKFIYISPSLGPLVYDQSLQGYDYDPQTKEAVTAKIERRINSLPIDRQLYRIIYSL